MLDSNSSLKLNRREFLRIIGAGAALTGVGAMIQACAPAPTPTAVPTPVPPTYARMTTSMMKLERFDEGGVLFRERVLPALKQMDGFKGVYELGDRKTGKSILITLWASEATMKAGESNGAYQQALALFKDFFTAPPTQQDYEVGLAA
jgi:heme-degrading monooxygenase HmoA